MKRILIVDDHGLIYTGLKETLSLQFSLDYAPDLIHARELMGMYTYDAYLLDITLGDEKGIDLVADIRENKPFFFLTMHRSAIYIKRAREMGAKGYFLKDDSPDLLVEALMSPMKRSFWMTGEGKKVLGSLPESPSTSYDTLTAREQQIFGLLAEGFGYKEIAYRLNISAKTVNNHRDRIMEKLSLNNMTEVVKLAIRIGVVSL